MKIRINEELFIKMMNDYAEILKENFEVIYEQEAESDTDNKWWINDKFARRDGSDKN